MLASRLFAVGLLASPVYAGELKSAVVTPASWVMQCDGPAQTVFWTNPESKTIYIKLSKVRLGSEFNNVCDQGGSIRKSSDRTFIGSFQRDDYGNPSGETEVITYFSPDYVSLPPGETLTSKQNCAKVGRQCTVSAMTGTIWYTVGEP